MTGIIFYIQNYPPAFWGKGEVLLSFVLNHKGELQPRQYLLIEFLRKNLELNSYNIINSIPIHTLCCFFNFLILKSNSLFFYAEFFEYLSPQI